MNKMKQHEAVIQALQELGGYGTLGQIYQKALSYPQVRWGTKTPQASIRRILQLRKEFFKIRPGLWGLRAREQDILQRLQIGAEASTEQREEFDHSYYQGIVAELGRVLGYPVHIPKQDRNRTSAGTPLRELNTLEEMPRFTYEDLVRRASTVDVVWFSRDEEHRFPVYLFEVEHTTNFHDSLVKFRLFIYFATKFFVVAPPYRKQEFQQKLKEHSEELQKRVQFLAYENLVKLYTIELERKQEYQRSDITPF